MTIKPSPWIRIQRGMYNIKYAQAIEMADKRLIISFVGAKKPVAFDFRHNLDELVQLYFKLQKLCRCNLPMPEPSKASMKEFNKLTDQYDKDAEEAYELYKDSVVDAEESNPLI